MPTPYDAELGKITDQDREYAADLFEEVSALDGCAEPVEVIAQWLMKVRYEAVIADRNRIAAGLKEWNDNL